MENLFGFPLAARVANPPIRQSANPPIRQSANPPIRQSANPPCWREQVYQLELANQPLTVNQFLPSSTRALTVSGRVVNSPHDQQPIITVRYAANGNPVAIIRMVAAPPL